MAFFKMFMSLFVLEFETRRGNFALQRCCLRAPTAMLLRSRDACSDSIAKLFCAYFFIGYRTIIARYVAKRGIAQMYRCKIRTKGGYRTILGECQPLCGNYRTMWGIAAIVSQYRTITNRRCPDPSLSEHHSNLHSLRIALPISRVARNTHKHIEREIADLKGSE